MVKSTGIASGKQVGNGSKNIVGNLPDGHVLILQEDMATHRAPMAENTCARR